MKMYSADIPYKNYNWNTCFAFNAVYVLTSTLVYWFACIFGIDANSRVSSGGGGQGVLTPPTHNLWGGYHPLLFLLIQKETCHQGIINSWLCYLLVKL